MKPFNWEKYLTLAHELSKKDEPEYARSAISRGYYSIFHKLQNIAGKNIKREKDLHKVFILELKNPDEKLAFKMGIEESEITNIANKLDFLRKARNDSDYEAFADINQTTVNKAFDRINLIIEILEGED